MQVSRVLKCESRLLFFGGCSRFSDPSSNPNGSPNGPATVELCSLAVPLRFITELVIVCKASREELTFGDS
jgi:hypothetical protein